MRYEESNKKIKLGDTVSSVMNDSHLWKITGIIEKFERDVTIGAKIVRYYILDVTHTKTNGEFIVDYSEYGSHELNEEEMKVLRLEKRREKTTYAMSDMVYSSMKNGEIIKIKIKDKVKLKEEKCKAYIVGTKKEISRDDKEMTFEYRILKEINESDGTVKKDFVLFTYENPANIVVHDFDRR
jgi:ribosomal protein L14